MRSGRGQSGSREGKVDTEQRRLGTRPVACDRAWGGLRIVSKQNGRVSSGCRWRIGHCHQWRDEATVGPKKQREASSVGYFMEYLLEI